MSLRPPSLLTAAALALALLPTTAPADAARAKRPDLTVPTATVSPATVAPGGTVRVTHAVRNTGPKAAKASTTRVHLVAGGRATLVGRRAVGAIRPRRTTTLPALAVTVPAGLADGSYAVRVCADDLRAVRESDERDNCRVAGTVRVKRPAPPVPPVPPIPAMDPGTTELDSFATTLSWPEDEADALWYLKLFCQANRPPQAFTLAGAVASLRAGLTQEAGAGMTALAASPSYDDPVELQELAAAGVAQGSPGLALAALLRTADLEPTIGTHLVNAASLAVSLGQPNEATALLDAAAARTFRTPAMGVPQQAVAATVRGQALVMTGRAEQARAWFLAARAAAPVLTEADTGLATIEACAGDDEKAARFLRKSRIRGHERTGPTAEPPRPDPLAEIELGAGRTTDLRHVALPVSPGQAVATIGGYDAMLDAYGGEIDDHNARETVLEQQLRAADDVATDAERDKRDSLLSLAWTATTPEIEAAEDEVSHVLDEIIAQKEAFWGGGTGEQPYVYQEISDDAIAACQPPEGPDCYPRYMNQHCRPALRSAHQVWLGLMGELQAAQDEVIALQSQLMSSIAAHLAEPAAYDLILLQIESLESIAHGGIVTRAWAWARDAEIRADYCVEPLPDEGVEGEDEPAAEGSGPCSPEAAKISYKFDLGPSEMKVNCEKVQQEFSTEVLPLLHAFAEISYDFRSGTLTVVAGAKAKGGVGGGEGSFKSGIYVSVETRDGGSLKDVGWQVGPEVTGTIAGVEAEVSKDEMDLSFIAGLKGD